VRDPILVRPPAGLAELVPDYLSMTRRQLDAALAGGDVQALRTVGHNVRGSAAPFGLTALGEIGQRLEQHAIAGAETDALACARELQDYLDRVQIVRQSA
jgi:HPt (histidine-containing phosphotransfer) domain-containing protein